MFDDTNTFQYLYFIMLYRIHYSLVKKGIEGFFFFFTFTKMMKLYIEFSDLYKDIV